MNKYRKRLDVYMTGRTFTGSDPIAILEFLAFYERACELVVTEGVAVWAIQFYLKGQAEGLIQSKLVGSSFAVDEDDLELLTSYREVVNCLLEKYATDEVIAEAYTDVTNFRQGSAVHESAFGQSLWDKTARCGIVFSDRRRKQPFVEGLMDSIRSQVFHHLSNHPDMTNQSLVKFAQGLGNTYRAARRSTSRVDFDERMARTKRPTPRSVLSVETSSTGARSDWDEATLGVFWPLKNMMGAPMRPVGQLHPPSLARPAAQPIRRPGTHPTWSLPTAGERSVCSQANARHTPRPLQHAPNTTNPGSCA